MEFETDERRARGSPIWLIIFADITTNLMLFFLMMFALSRMSSENREMIEKGVKGAISKKSEKVVANKERIERRMREDNAIHGLQNVVSGKLFGHSDMSVNKGAIKLTLDPLAFFATGSAEITPSAMDAIGALIEPLRQFSNATVVIEGHTDNVPVRGGRFRSNWELSIARAVSVIDFFVSEGLSPGKLVAGGYGEYHPAFPNDTDEHRAKNRRIEITIIRQAGA